MQGEVSDSVFTADVHVVVDTLTHYVKQGKAFNRWFESGPLKVYIRRQKVIVSREAGIKDSLTIANLTVRESERGKGTFKELLGSLERLARREMPDGVLYLENVVNHRLAAHLSARGYSRKVIGQDDLSFYKCFR